jgi:hypothetical protein
MTGLLFATMSKGVALTRFMASILAPKSGRGLRTKMSSASLAAQERCAEYNCGVMEDRACFSSTF